MELSLDIIIQLFAVVSPILLPILFIMQSFFNQNLNALIYLAGLTLLVLLTKLGRNMTEPRGWKYNEISPLCSFFEFNAVTAEGRRTMPCIHAVMISYSVFYVLTPLLLNVTEKQTGGTMITTGFLLLMFANGAFRYTMKCVRVIDIFTGWIIGGFIGIFYYLIVTAIPGGYSYTYFPPVEYGDEKCKKLSDTNFVCKYEDKEDDDTT